MSAEAVKQIIGRAMTEPDFREQLLADPGTALAGFELTVEEQSALKKVTRASFDATAGELEERVSRAGLGRTSSCRRARAGRSEVGA